MIRNLYQDNGKTKAILAALENGRTVTETELLALLLEDGCAGSDAMQIAARLLQEYGDLSALCEMPLAALQHIDGVGERGAQLLKTCKAVADCLLHHRDTDDMRQLFRTEEFADYLAPYFVDLTVERLYLLMMNSGYKVLGIKMIAQGDACSLTVDKKLVLDTILKHRATRVVLAHNHFVSLLPSMHDVVLTNDLRELLDQLDVRLIDHIIFFGSKSKSMRKSGYFKEKDKTV